MAAVDGLVLRADNENQLVAALTVADGGTLADRADVSALLVALDPYAPYQLMVTNRPRPMLDEQAEATPAPLLPSALVASARTITGGRRTTIVALVHTTTEDASENARRLQRNLTDGSVNGQPSSERFESWTVTADGPLALAVIDEANNEPADPYIDQLWRSEPT